MSTISSSGKSESLQGHDDDWHTYLMPDDSGNFAITPLAIIEHARNDEKKERYDRELIKELSTDDVTGRNTAVYRVLSGVEYDEDDSTQSSWDMEYGLECSEDGLARAFLNIDDEGIDNPEAYAASIAENIFPPLKERTEDYYSRQ